MPDDLFPPIPPRPPIPDGYTNPDIARMAALRDRLAEILRRVADLGERIDACPRGPDGELVENETTAAMRAELEQLMHEGEAIESAGRAIMAKPAQ